MTPSRLRPELAGIERLIRLLEERLELAFAQLRQQPLRATDVRRGALEVGEECVMAPVRPQPALGPIGEPGTSVQLVKELVDSVFADELLPPRVGAA